MNSRHLFVCVRPPYAPFTSSEPDGQARTHAVRHGLAMALLDRGSSLGEIGEIPTHDGYNHLRVTAAIRMKIRYPNTELNMVYFFPALARKDGRAIGATQAKQVTDRKTYRRWSRHRTAQNPWRPGVDGVDTHVFLIEDWLAREFER